MDCPAVELGREQKWVKPKRRNVTGDRAGNDRHPRSSLELGRFRYPWLDDAAFDDLRKDYFPADYRADAAEMPVDGWVHIQAEVDHQLDPVAETARGGVDCRRSERRRPARSAGMRRLRRLAGCECARPVSVTAGTR